MLKLCLVPYNGCPVIQTIKQRRFFVTSHKPMASQKHIKALVLTLLATFCFSSGTQAEDIIVSIGSGTGEAGAKNKPVTLVLDNPAETVKGIQLYVCDEGNYLAAKSCMATGRAAKFLCTLNECRTDAKSAECRHYPGCANIVLYAPGEVIAGGRGPVAVLNFDVSENAPAGCVTLDPKKVIVSDQDRKSLSAMAERGRFCISGGSGDDTTTTAGPSNPTPENPEEMPPTDSTNSISAPGSSTHSSGPLASPQSGLRTPLGGTSAADRESSYDGDAGTVGSSGSSSRKRTTGGGSDEYSGAADARSAGVTATKGSGSKESRLIISPPLSVINSKGVLALNAYTIFNGKEVQGKYKWEIQPPSAIGSTIDGDGIFTAGINTSASPVQETIRVTDISNKSISSTATITIEGAKEPPEGCTLVVTPSSAEVAPGHVIAFTATRLGQTCAEGSYQWKVSSKIGSTITAEGVYTAGVNRGNAAALDIILVKDGEANLSIDALVTVTPGDESAAASKSPHADGRSDRTGSPLLPGTVIAAAAFVAVVGVLLARKKK